MTAVSHEANDDTTRGFRPGGTMGEEDVPSSPDVEGEKDTVDLLTYIARYVRAVKTG